jgi:DNA-binding GntR family transcriptional regulator
MKTKKEEFAGLKYEQITQELRERLEQSVYEVGMFLPAERSLAEEFGVSRPTLRKALVPLIEAGLLVNQPGVGTRVAPLNGARTRALKEFSSAQPLLDQQAEARSDWRILALLLPDITNRFLSKSPKPSNTRRCSAAINYCSAIRVIRPASRQRT